MPAFAEVVSRGLIVSCQAAPGDAFHGPESMARMAMAAEQAGAIGIRANGGADIAAIRKVTALPIVGIVKTLYPTSPILITPTFDEAMEAVQAGAAIVALDATQRIRPRGESVSSLIDRIHKELRVPVLADVSNLAEGVAAEARGADAIATTLSGYVGETPCPEAPDLELVTKLARVARVPVVAEGRYGTPAEARTALARGAYAVVVGTAITQPHAIARRFVTAMQEAERQ